MHVAAIVVQACVGFASSYSAEQYARAENLMLHVFPDQSFYRGPMTVEAISGTLHGLSSAQSESGTWYLQPDDSQSARHDRVVAEIVDYRQGHYRLGVRGQRYCVASSGGAPDPWNETCTERFVFDCDVAVESVAYWEGGTELSNSWLHSGLLGLDWLLVDSNSPCAINLALELMAHVHPRQVLAQRFLAP